MDKVYIHGLKVDTIIGIFDWERTQRQTVVIDVEMACHIGASAATEDIGLTVSYKDVADRLVDFITSSEFLLVETMAEAIAQLILDEFAVPWLSLKLGKPGAIAVASDVGVIIQRGVRPA